jgi:DNA modification methylase
MIFNDDWLNNNIVNESIDLIITDPPHGVNLKHGNFDDSKTFVFAVLHNWIQEMSRVLKEGSHCYIYAPTLELDKWIHAVKEYLTFKNVVIAPNYGANKYVSNNFMFDYQPIIFCSNGKAKPFNKVDWIKTSNEWFNDKRNKNPKRYTYQYPAYLSKDNRADVKSNATIKLLHKCQKNVNLIDKFILLSSQENEIVLDPFAGSGSTLISARDLNRNFIGYEIHGESYDIMNKRLKNDYNKRQNYK